MKKSADDQVERHGQDLGIPLPRTNPSVFKTEKLAHFDGAWTKQTLANGMTALHIPTPHDDHFFLGVMIRTGSRMEKPEQAGISHFLEHMMFRGCKRFPEFTRLAEAFEWLGGEWNAATGQEHTEYWYSGIRHTAADVVELFADFLENPALNDIEVERKIILRELDGELNEFGHSTDLDHHVATLLWPDASMALPILGHAESLEGISVTALRAYRDRFYIPKNMAICAVGGQPDDHIQELLAKHFSDHRGSFTNSPQPSYPALPSFQGPAVKWVEHSDNEYSLQLSFLSEGEWSAKAPAYELITRILSDGFCSRLGRRLREELGLVYDVAADSSLYLEMGTLDITADVAPAQLDKFMSELFTLLRRLSHDGPSSDELERARVRAIVDLELSPSSPEHIGSRLCWAAICQRHTSLSEDRAKLLAVDVASVKQICSELFSPAKAAFVALGPSGKDLEKRLRKALVNGLS